MEEQKEMRMEDILKGTKKIWQCRTCKAPQYISPETIIKDCSCGSKDVIQIGISYPNGQTIEEYESFILQDTYEKIIGLLDDWVIVSDDVKKFIAIWVIGTYYHENFSTYPYLFFNAMRGSGKTRLMRIISWIGNKGDGSVQNDMREAVLFRMPRNKVLCIDELENIGSKDKQTLRQILNSAYKKGLKITRMRKATSREGEKFVQEEFEPYMPVCMANIWGMDEVLGDRAITFILEKSINPITKKVEDFEVNPTIKDIKRNFSVVWCSVVTEKHIYIHWNNYIKNKYQTTSIHNIHITTPNYITTQEEDKEYEKLLPLFNKIDEAGIDGRNFELMFPILITAQKISNNLLDDMLKICKSLIKEKREDEFTESKDVNLLQFISTSVDSDWIDVKKLTQDFRTYLCDLQGEEPWLNEKWMGRALKRLGLVKVKRRLSIGYQVMIDIDKAKNKAVMFKVKKEDDKPLCISFFNCESRKCDSCPNYKPSGGSNEN